MEEASGLRVRKRRATRAAIVRAATGLFLEKGFTATSVTEIASTAGISRRTFFLHFPSKEDVLFHHIEDHIQVAVAATARQGPEATAWDAVQLAMSALVNAFDETATGTDDLAGLRAELIRTTSHLPGSLMIRLQSVHTILLDALRERFPDRTVWPKINAHLGACIGAATATALETPPDRRQAAMREAVRSAGQGFR